MIRDKSSPLCLTCLNNRCVPRRAAGAACVVFRSFPACLNVDGRVPPPPLCSAACYQQLSNFPAVVEDTSRVLEHDVRSVRGVGVGVGWGGCYRGC